MFGSNVELEKLKKRVEILEAKVSNLMRSAGHDIPKSQSGASEEVMELLRKGNKIGAIKVYRKQSGANLKDAKEYVESLNQ